MAAGCESFVTPYSSKSSVVASYYNTVLVSSLPQIALRLVTSNSRVLEVADNLLVDTPLSPSDGRDAELCAHLMTRRTVTEERPNNGLLVI